MNESSPEDPEKEVTWSEINNFIKKPKSRQYGSKKNKESHFNMFQRKIKMTKEIQNPKVLPIKISRYIYKESNKFSSLFSTFPLDNLKYVRRLPNVTFSNINTNTSTQVIF